MTTLAGLVEEIEKHFNEKVRRANLSDGLKERIDELIDNATEEIDDILREVDRKIDCEIEQESTPVYTYEQEYRDMCDFIYKNQL